LLTNEKEQVIKEKEWVIEEKEQVIEKQEWVIEDKDEIINKVWESSDVVTVVRVTC
jgi:hypothetical protein